MSKEERDIILQMLSEGKISPSEAGDLLEALETQQKEDLEQSTRPFESGRHEYRNHERHGNFASRDSLHQHGLLIRVSEGEETRTRVHIPLGMAFAAGKFMPKKAQEYFDKYGIDLKEVLDSVAGDLGRRGEIVDVNDGETRVQIVVT